MFTLKKLSYWVGVLCSLAVLSCNQKTVEQVVMPMGVKLQFTPTADKEKSVMEWKDAKGNVYKDTLYTGTSFNVVPIDSSKTDYLVQLKCFNNIEFGYLINFNKHAYHTVMPYKGALHKFNGNYYVVDVNTNGFAESELLQLGDNRQTLTEMFKYKTESPFESVMVYRNDSLLHTTSLKGINIPISNSDSLWYYLLKNKQLLHNRP